MAFFDKFPEFVELDTRKNRGYSPVNAESLDNRHEISLPENIVKDCTVLDLGSCIGATGHWVLSNGCKHYTGVEYQPKMVETSNNLLSKFWSPDQFTVIKQDLRVFLKQAVIENKKWDIVVAVGIIYAFLDTYGILKEIAEIANTTVIIDSIYPNSGGNGPIIGISKMQNINSEDDNTAFSGAGARPSPEAMKMLMEALKFTAPEGLLYPVPLSDRSVHDTYNTLIDRPWVKDTTAKLPLRYMLRFTKSNSTNLVEVGALVVNNVREATVPMSLPPELGDNATWTFDKAVADRFQQEATQHIPDYQRVINMCYGLSEAGFRGNKSVNIIDVGSALGHTMDKFIKGGYTNVYGVDNSPSMVQASLYPDRVTLSDSFPTDKKWDMVLANWTLHFIQNREEYIRDICDSLNPGGVMIITDKMDHPIELERLYHNFKRKNGVSDEIIIKKKAALQGVLVPRPIDWYLDLLKSLNFSRIQIVNSCFMFSTIYAKKL